MEGVKGSLALHVSVRSGGMVSCQRMEGVKIRLAVGVSGNREEKTSLPNNGRSEVKASCTCECKE
jgi:hypothetical protein